MCQRDVERVVGRLVTDETTLRRFTADPQGTLEEMVDSGMELTCTELRALARLDGRLVTRLAEALDPCICKVGTSRE